MSSMSFFFTLYQSPRSNENFKILLYSLKNDYSSTLVQEGTFNTFGKDFTIFVKERKHDGLHNVFIHDTRDEERTSTLIAKKGKIVSTGDSTKILLESGSQQFQSKEKLSVLYFDEYLLDINQNNSNDFLNRWKSPSERTMYELRNPDPQSGDDLNNLQAFKAEITLRYTLPLNVIGFGILIMFVMVSFSFQRKENIFRTILVFSTIIILQSISIISSNLSIKLSDMEILNFFPILFCTISLLTLIKRSQKL